MTNQDNTTMVKPDKLYGMYPQKQDGLYMQRIPIFGGVITAKQLGELARIAEDFADGTPLHLTTRQDIELHNVPMGKLNILKGKLEAIGLPTYGACGDGVRNFTVCPCCAFNADAYDVLPLARMVKETLLNSGELDKIPRKIKMSFAGCDDPQSKPYSNCLAFIATSENTVRVIGAGSLGSNPEPGVILFETLPAGDAAALALGVLKLFIKYSDRENRKKSRLRHIRQRMGDEAFLELVKEYFQKEKSSASFKKVTFGKGQSGWEKIATMQTIAGDLEIEHAVCLSEFLKQNDGEIRINLTHGLDIYAKHDLQLPAEIGEYAALPIIVACPGNTTCKNGLVNCPAETAKLSAALKNNPAVKGKIIAMSGCPNNCVHSCLADIGLSGRLKTFDAARHEAYTVFAGGDNGKTRQMAAAKQTVKSEELLTEIENILNGEAQ